MTQLQKINYLELLLNESNDSYADSFKTDILFYFNDDFTEENLQFHFLNQLETKDEIEKKLDFLLSQFVLKFDPVSETEFDFIHYYLH